MIYYRYWWVLFFVILKYFHGFCEFQVFFNHCYFSLYFLFWIILSIMCQICSDILCTLTRLVGFESYVWELRVAFTYGTIHFICEIMQMIVPLRLILLIGRGYSTCLYIWISFLFAWVHVCKIPMSFGLSSLVSW